MRAQVSRYKSDKNNGNRHCRAAGSCQRCFVVDLSNYRCILKSSLSFFVMNRENFKQAFFHQFMHFLIGMCLEENYSDSPSNKYSRHYSAESKSEYLQRQNMDSKLGEDQKKGHHDRRSPNFDPNSYKKQKKVKMIMV